MTLFITSVASWTAAVAGYVGVSILMSGRVSVGDTQSLALWGGVMAAIAVPFVYLPIMTRLRRRTRLWWPFPLVGGCLGVVPSMLFAMLWSGGGPLAGLFTQAGLILFTVFAVFGISFGAGFRSWPKPA